LTYTAVKTLPGNIGIATDYKTTADTDLVAMEHLQEISTLVDKMVT